MISYKEAFSMSHPWIGRPRLFLDLCGALLAVGSMGVVNTRWALCVMNGLPDLSEIPSILFQDISLPYKFSCFSAKLCVKKRFGTASSRSSVM